MLPGWLNDFVEQSPARSVRKTTFNKQGFFLCILFASGISCWGPEIRIHFQTMSFHLCEGNQSKSKFPLGQPHVDCGFMFVRLCCTKYRFADLSIVAI
jgi:hypothetical protein